MEGTNVKNNRSNIVLCYSYILTSIIIANFALYWLHLCVLLALHPEQG